MARWLFNIVIGIYNSVGKVYDMLIDFVKDSNINFARESFGDLIENVYVLCGLFMLFRLTVSFLNILIDPDKANDKQAGAGAIIKRVFVSLILIILFQPNSIILNPSTGLLARIERAVLTNDNSLLNNIMPETNTETSKTQIKKSLSIMFEDVYAANELQCFYAAYKLTSGTTDFKGSSTVDGDNMTLTNTFIQSVPVGNLYITFTKNASNATNIEYKHNINKSPWYIQYSEKDKLPSGIKYDNRDLNSVKKFKFDTKESDTSYLENGTCPKGLSITNNVLTFHKNTTNDGYNYYAKLESSSISERELLAKKEAEVNKSKDKFGNTGGYSKFIEENAEEFYKNDPTLTAEEITAAARRTSDNASTPPAVNDGKTLFVRSLFLTFVNQIDDNEDTTNKLNSVFSSPEANDEVWKLMKSEKNPKVEMDLLLAIIVGIAVIIYLFILCVDVVVRQFKLIVLEIMAPIPIISYIDPKDKIFDEWKKMFISVYIDLFVKLIVINIGIRSINLLYSTSSSYHGFKQIMVLMGIFVFVKGLPNLISKIFGIDASATSFKEIGNVMKRGTGMAIGGAIGAGAALGSGVMAFTASKGQSAGNRLLAAASGIKNVASGALRGIGGGYSGNVMGGISAAQANMRNRQAYSQGISASALASGAILGGIGMDYASRQDRKVADMQEQVKAYDELGNTKKTMKEIWESSDLYSNMIGMKDENGNNLYGQEELDAARDLWMTQQFGVNPFENGAWQKKNGEYLDENSDDYKFRESVIEKLSTRGLSFKTETSKKAQLEDAVRDANAKKRGSSTLSTTFGDKEFKNWEDVVAMEKTTTEKKRELQGKINENTIADPMYNQAAAARDIRNNNK